MDQFSQPGMPLCLDYIGNNDQVDASQCDRDIGVINDCKLFCQQYYDGAGGNQVNLCDNSQDGVSGAWSRVAVAGYIYVYMKNKLAKII